MRVVIDAGLLEPGQLDVRETARVLLELLRALVVANLAWLRKHPDTPHPYEAGVRYAREEPTGERWQSIPQILRSGSGDCEDLAAYLAAWYRARGQSARIVLKWMRLPRGGWLYHVLVRGPSGELEDPSKRLGM